MMSLRLVTTHTEYSIPCNGVIQTYKSSCVNNAYLCHGVFFKAVTISYQTLQIHLQLDKDRYDIQL